jgi:hypothetical protein
MLQFLKKKKNFVRPDLNYKSVAVLLKVEELGFDKKSKNNNDSSFKLTNEFFDNFENPVESITSIGKIAYKTIDPIVLLEYCLPFLQVPLLFDWIQICVTVIPILLFLYTSYLIIYSSSISYQYSKILKKQKYDLTTDQLNMKKDDVFYELTILNLKKSIRFIKILLFLQIINPINWTKYLPLYGGFLISTPSISLILCFLLICVLIGFKLILDQVIRLKINAPDLAIILLFMVFFLCLMLYSNHFIPFYFGIEGTALSTCIALVLLFDTKISFSNLKVLFKSKLFLKLNLSENKTKFKYNLLLNNWKLQKKINQEAVAAGMLYFLLNIFVTIILAYLFFFLILNFNTLSFFSLFTLFLSISNADFEIGLVIILFLIVFCFKLGIAPFHFWLPGVFSGANYGIFFFFSHSC